jgi:hypothetical protein
MGAEKKRDRRIRGRDAGAPRQLRNRQMCRLDSPLLMTVCAYTYQDL